MSNVPTLYERNATFAAAFDKGDLPLAPGFSTVILTCVDARVDPAHYAGLELGDALVLRNVGARVTDAIVLEISILWTLMALASGKTPSLELAIIEHTDCGMARFADPEVAAKVTDRFGTGSVVDTYAIVDPATALADDVERLRAVAMVPRELRVSGHLYDVASGRLTELIPTQSLG